MHLQDPFIIAYRTFTAAKLRFFLTILGIIIGVAAVVMVMSIGASAQRLVFSQVENVGSNLVGILPGASQEDGPPAQAFGIVTTSLTVDDLKALREKHNVSDFVAASGYVTGSANIESNYEEFETSFQGVSPQMIDVENIEIQEGRFFDLEEEMDLSRVVVLGATQAEELFPGRSPVGETVRIKDQPYKVIGVLAPQGSSLFSNADTAVYVPLGTAQKLLLGINYLNFIRAKVNSPENIPKAIDEATVLLRDRHDIDDDEESDFSIRNTAAALDILGNVTNVLRYFLGAIASVSLLVGGIGIMNSMLISVSQRIREIGLRKAVGARSGHILNQFLLESATLTVAGGIIGILIGVFLTWIISLVVSGMGYTWEFLVPPSGIILGFTASLLIGITFGLSPARRAAKISPTEALHYE
jgi:putative ABC transport system permease protein